MVEELEDTDNYIVGSDDEWTNYSTTDETSSSSGSSVSGLIRCDSADTDMMDAVVAVEAADNDDCTMEMEEEEEEPSKGAFVESTLMLNAMDDEDGDHGDVLDLEKLYELLEQSKSAGDLIAGKNVMLLIGSTGAGKTTTTLTTLYLAGVKFQEIEVKGLDHFEPQNLPPDLVQFAVSGGATSVTKTIHATTVELPGGETITVCDTPGFGDTKGTEMEISNGLGVIHALKRAASVKPVLVLNHKGMDDSRYAPLRKTLGTVIEMMGHRKDFSPFEYVFTRCEGKSIVRVHRQLAGFQDSLRESAKDILGDSVDIKDVLDALLTDMVAKTKPEALSIDPTESDDAPRHLEALWSKNMARIDRPGDEFIDFIPQDASNKLDCQLNSMSSRMGVALKAMRFGQADEILQQLIRLASVLPLPQMENAVMKGKGKARAFVKHLQSEACQLVDRMVEQSELGKVTHIVPGLRKKLLLLSETSDICGICDVPVDGRYEAFLASMVARLFAALASSVVAIDEPNVMESQGLLQSSLLRAVCIANALDGLGCSELSHAFLTFKAKVFAKTQSVLSQVLDFEGDADDISSAVMDEMRTGLLFLVDMYAFFDTHGITLAGLDLGRKAVQMMLSRLAEKSDDCLTRLDELAGSIRDLDDTTESLSFTIDALCSRETQESRQYILSLLSSAPLVNAVYSNHQQSEQSLALVIENFDIDLTWVIQKFADSAQNSTDAIVERKSAQSIKERIKAAEDLKRIVATTSSFFDSIQKWSSFDWQLDATDKHFTQFRKI